MPSQRLFIFWRFAGIRLFLFLMHKLTFAFCLFVSLAHSAETRTAKNREVFFSPAGGCTEAVVNALEKAKASVLVQAYSFTSAPIAKALVDAKRRGVNVQVVLDKTQKTDKYSSADFLRNSGVATFIDTQHGVAHNKVMVIVGQTVITGSFNFTKAAEAKNAENLLVIQDVEMAKKYAANWSEHL